MERSLSMNAKFLLKCVFRFSANQNCRDSARKMLLAFSTGDSTELERQYVYAGSFMQACADGDVIAAWNAGDTHNRLAIEMGMKNHFTDDKRIWCEGLDPEEFKEKK